MRLFGKNPVIERIKVNPRSIKKIYLQEAHPDALYIKKKARKWGLALYVVPKSKMIKMTRHANSQGVLAEVDDFTYLLYEDLLDLAVKKKLSLLFLDELKDPQNLGAIVRSLACLGNFAIVLPKKESVEVTEAVSRVACGGENYVHIAKVANLSRAILEAKERGFWIAGAVVEDGQDIYDAKFSYPVGLVVGSEQKGIRSPILKHLDMKITIPMKQARLSLNAAQATTIFCYEITKQKKKT
ncbi:MAG: 23S rRNA (guanosine(2251)-2'-O)-methyltransferase RlmB [Candidatus Aceula meridiana]|nr:23S rRNA (guanosine(2251)-2'-O)-methyltransferase RlmB [Candidatus Aceula meridiana]